MTLALDPGGTVEVLFTTIAKSTLPVTTPVFFGNGAVFVTMGVATITNTIFANHDHAIVTALGRVTISDYNLFYHAPTTIITGSHSLTDVNPLFVDPAANNYHLAFGSPAAARGLTIPPITTDLDALVVGDELERLLERHRPRRHEPHDVVRARGARCW